MRKSLSWINVILYAAGFIFQAGIIVYFYINFDAAILRLMPDDAFYYLKIAENISNGLGSVFSVNELTNGYHPLWMVLLTMLHYVTCPTPEQFIIWALGLAISLNVLAAHLFFLLLRAFDLSELQSWLGVAAYLFSPWLVSLTLTGLETPLFYGCLFGFLLAAQRQLTNWTPLTFRGSVWLGVTAGLAMLARTDAIFFTAPAFALILLKEKRRSLKFLIAAGLLSVLIVSPWLVWNLVTFGTITQSSSIAISALNHYLYPPVSSWQYWRLAWQNFVSATYWAIFAPLITHTKYSVKLEWGNVALAIVLSSLALAIYRRWVRRDLKVPFLLYGPAIALVFFYCAVRLFVQVWHLAALCILVIVFLLNFVPRKLQRVYLLAFVIVLLPLTIYSTRNCYFRPQEWVGRINYFQHRFPYDSPESLVVCITDSGIPGYFSKHTVVNMDGVANNRALAYILAGRFSEYVALKKCDTVIMDENRLVFYDRNLPVPLAH